jgi:hypothetical protein
MPKVDRLFSLLPTIFGLLLDALRFKGRPHSGLGPGIPEPSEGIPVLEISGYRIPRGHRVVGSSVLGGLHHEYRLEKMAA